MSSKKGLFSGGFCDCFEGDKIWILIILVIIFCCCCGNDKCDC